MPASNENLLQMYRYMSMARSIELLLGKLPGFHPAVGEEAVVIGAFYGLDPEDYIAPHYRGALAAALLRGADLRRLIAGVLGKVTGYNSGRFRGDISMPIELRVIGMSCGILGSTLGLATGAALSAKMRRTADVVVVTFGEGSSNLGAFHENINLGATLNLPIVYICQNNQFAMSTRATQSMKCPSVADRAIGYGIPGVKVDGNDVIEVHRTVQEAVRRARSGNGPTLIEALTYRVSGHYGSEHPTYQDVSERDSWRGRDPLRRLERSLFDAGLLSAAEADRIKRSVEDQVVAANVLAHADPDPDPTALGIDDVYAPTSDEELVS